MTSPQDELARYFEVCGYQPDDTISIVTRAAADGPLFWGFHTVADAPRQIAARSGINCWFSANPMHEPDADPETGRRGRGATKDVYAIRALWADLDIKPGGLADKKQAKEVIEGISRLLGARPVALVWSGHGFQPRWKLDPNGLELHTPERMAPVIERFGELVKMLCGGKADSVYDLPRIIRAPFTMNIKPEMEPVPTKVWLYEHGEYVTFERLLETLDAYLPATDAPKRQTAPAEIRHVSNERGNAYVESALEYIRGELQKIKSWKPGETDDRGRGWEKIQADTAFRLASLAKAEWNDLTLERAQEIFVDNAPVDNGWTVRDVIKKWQSQVRRAEPADPPGDTDDPLAGGARPLASAPARAGADIWATSGDDGEAGAPGRTEELPEEPTPGPVAEELTTEWRKFTWDEFGNADRTVHLFGSELRYSPTNEKWYRYETGAWRETKTGGEKAVQAMLRGLFKLEGPLYDDTPIRRGQRETSEQDDFYDFIKSSRTAAKAAGAAKVIRNDGTLDVPAAAFDAHPLLLNARNGVIDLASAELLEHDPELLLRRQIPIDFDPDAKAAKWEAFLERVMPSPDMRDYLQRIVGYSITGSTKEQVVFFHVGPPASGKSVFIEVLGAMLGEFAGVIPSSTLLNKKTDQHPADIMSMDGRRLLSLDETPEGARLDEALIKRLSGETKQTARGMGENWREFKLVGKVHLVTNHDPHISDDAAMHRRLHYIPWRNPIPVEERHQGLKDEIIAEELEGVLAWAVRGAAKWRQDKLARPAEAEMARSEYLSNEDEFAVFIDDELVLGADNAFTPSVDVYRRYRQWCDVRGMKAMSMVAFGRKLSRRGVEPGRTMYARGFKCFLKSPAWTQDPLG